MKSRLFIGIIVTAFIVVATLFFIQQRHDPLMVDISFPITPTTPPPVLTSQSNLTLTVFPKTTKTVEYNLELHIDEHIRTSPPIVLVYQENCIVKFMCLNSKDCFQDIDLTKFKNIEEKMVRNCAISLHSVHYINLTSIYIVLVKYETEPKMLVLHLNSKTNQASATVVPLSALWGPTYRIHKDKLVVLSRTGHKTLTSNDIQDTLYIIQSDLSINQIDLDSTCLPRLPSPGMLFEGIDNQIIILGIEEAMQEGKLFAEACIVDIKSGKQIKQFIQTPFEVLENQKGKLETAGNGFGAYNTSPDLEKLYYLYVNTEIKNTGHILGMYNTKTKEEKSIYTEQCINMQTGYQKYNDMLFSSKECSGDINAECYGNTTLIRMSDLEPIICEESELDYPLSRTRVVPFGDYFLLDNRNQSIILVTPEGDKLDYFTLMPKFLHQDYRIIEYRK